MFATYDITFLIYFDISFDFETDEDKKEKKVYLFQEEKKKRRREREREKRSICVHRESNPNEQIQSPMC